MSFRVLYLLVSVRNRQDTAFYRNINAGKFMDKIITTIENWLKEAKKEHKKALAKDDEYDVEYWDGKVQAFDDVLLLLDKNNV